MKFRVMMKTPDALEMAVAEAVDDQIGGMEFEDDDQREDARQDLEREAYRAAKSFFRYGEYLTVELDTEAKTCVVVPNGG